MEVITLVGGGVALCAILLLPMLLLTESGCQTIAGCNDTDGLALGYPLLGFQGRTCSVEIVGPAGRARYEVPPLPLRGRQRDPGDGGVCWEDATAAVDCVQLDGPNFSGKRLCARFPCGVAFRFDPEDTRRLTDFIGAATFDVIVTCGDSRGASQLRETITLPQQVCPL